jgi:hypothetical protein
LPIQYLPPHWDAEVRCPDVVIIIITFLIVVVVILFSETLR